VPGKRIAALALVGSFELLMLLIRTHPRGSSIDSEGSIAGHFIRPTDHAEPLVVMGVPSLEQTVQTWYAEGRSQREIARELDIGRRKVKQIIDRIAAL
jgi:DNA-binding NarL/FixJ family response regulator